MTQTKVKAREQQTAMAVRLRDAEELLKDRVAAKNAEIDDLKNQLEVHNNAARTCVCNIHISDLVVFEKCFLIPVWSAERTNRV